MDLSSQFLDIAYRAIVDDHAFADAMRWIENTFSVPAMMYVLPHNKQTPETLLLANMQEKTWAEYTSYYWTKDPCVPHRLAAPSDRTFTNVEFYGDEDLATNEHVNEFLMAQLGGSLVYAIKLHQSSRGSGLLTICVPDHVAEQRKCEIVTFLDNVRPHLQRIVAIRDRQAGPPVHGPTHEVLASLELPLMLVDSEGQVLWANTMGERCLAEAKGGIALERSSRSVRLHNDHPLMAAIAHGAREDRTMFEACFPLGPASLVRALIVRRRVLGSMDMMFDRNATFWVTIHNYQDEEAPISPAFEEHFGLTRAEVDVLVEVRKGLSVKEISERSGKSSNTVRNQLHSIMSKTSTTTRAELILLLGAA